VVLRFEATTRKDLEAYQAEVMEWLAGQGVRG
jgi:hypothetical protein